MLPCNSLFLTTSNNSRGTTSTIKNYLNKFGSLHSKTSIHPYQPFGTMAHFIQFFFIFNLYCIVSFKLLGFILQVKYRWHSETHNRILTIPRLITRWNRTHVVEILNNINTASPNVSHICLAVWVTTSYLGFSQLVTFLDWSLWKIIYHK